MLTNEFLFPAVEQSTTQITSTESTTSDIIATKTATRHITATEPTINHIIASDSTTSQVTPKPVRGNQEQAQIEESNKSNSARSDLFHFTAMICVLTFIVIYTE